MGIYKIPGEKKDGFQKYRVVVNYTDAYGKKRTAERRVYGKAAAEGAEAELRAKVQKGVPANELRLRPMTVKELLDLYKIEKKNEIRQTTMAKKVSILNTHVIPILGKYRLRDLNPDILNDWRNRMNEKPIKTITRNGAYKELRALLNYAVARDFLTASPLNKIPPFRDPYQETAQVRLRYYTKEEYGKYIAEAEKWAAARSDVRSKGICLFFKIAYLTGMRKGEINALRWSDVEDGYIWVRRSVAQKIKGEKWIETPPKNMASVRRIQLPAQLSTALEKHKDLQRRGAKNWNESFFICGGTEPIPDTTIEKANTAFSEAAGIKHITIHEFRHSHASLLCNAGINIKEIARRLGHSRVEMTLKTYAHLYPKEEELAVAVLDKI